MKRRDLLKMLAGFPLAALLPKAIRSKETITKIPFEGPAEIGTVKVVTSGVIEIPINGSSFSKGDLVGFKLTDGSIDPVGIVTIVRDDGERCEVAIGKNQLEALK